MEDNVSCLSISNTWMAMGETLHHGKVNKLSRSGILGQILWKGLAAFTSIQVWTLAFLGIFLVHLHSANAMPLICPSRCHCSNASQMFNLTMNCSNGGFQAFFDTLSAYDQTTFTTANTTYNSQTHHGESNDAGPFTLKNDNNQTSIFVSLENKETQQGTLERNVEIDLDGKLDSSGKGQNYDTFASAITLDLSFNNISSYQLVHLYEWGGASLLVKQLNLSNNIIETLENTSIHQLINLVSLDLSNNHISIFNTDAFKHFSSLKYLYINNNKIVNIYAQITDPISYTQLTNLVGLDLSNNHITELPDEAFSAFPMLKSLNLSHNRVNRLSHFAFTGLPRLQSLSLSHNLFVGLDYPVFQNTSLTHLFLTDLPKMTTLHHNAFQGLQQLQYLNLSHNVMLDFLNPNILSDLKSLKVLDLSGTGIQQLSPITFQNNFDLQLVYLQDMPMTCQCTNAWLAEQIVNNNSIFQNVSTLQCRNIKDNTTVSLADAEFSCEKIFIHNMTHKLSIGIGSTLMLRCKQTSTSQGDILSWTTPRGNTYYFHHFHPNASQHLLNPRDVTLDSPFHKSHYWHHSSSYHSDLDSHEDRILILSDGSLFIDYILRSDAGPYTCLVKNAYHSSTETIVVQLQYAISSKVKILACVVGLLCAAAFFTLNLLYVIISWLARHLINKRRREHIRQMLENLNNYKSGQITRIYENYTCQLNRVRNRYHTQRDRLHRNYTMQVERVKRGCSHQVEKVRENYNSRLNQLREYSSNQIMQIRDLANTQIGRIRDYGSLQLDRLRETYKLQQQHVLKLLDTMNLDNCRSIVETECMRTESMMYDLDLLSQEDERTDSPFSFADSEYNTATSSPLISMESREPYYLGQNEKEIVVTEAENDLRTIQCKNDNSILPKSQFKEVKTDALFLESTRKEEKLLIIDESCTQDETERDSTPQLYNNVQLDAEEVWTYQKEDETQKLYTKVHLRKKKRFVQTEPPYSSDEEDERQDMILGEDETETRKIVAAVSLPSIDLTSSSCLRIKDNAMIDSSKWEGDFVKTAGSPTKEWRRQSSPFPYEYEDDEDMVTVNLYDADVDEDEVEEKTESDTMV